MANDTQITVVGNVVADPELRFLPNGDAVANFTVASTPRKFDRQANEYVDEEPLFLRCSAWREYAENVAESLTKGMRVIVQGNLRMRRFTDKDGADRTSTEMQVTEVGPALRFAVARVRKATPGNGGQGAQGGAQGGRGASRGPNPQGGGYNRSQGQQGARRGGAPQGDPWGQDQGGAQGFDWGTDSQDEPPF